MPHYRNAHSVYTRIRDMNRQKQQRRSRNSENSSTSSYKVLTDVPSVQVYLNRHCNVFKVSLL